MAAVRGGNAIRRRLKIIRRNVDDAIESELDDAANELLASSRKLAPQLTGLMIQTSGVDGEDRRNRFRRSVFYEQRYAVIQHEGFFNPGPITRQKPGAGRKYLQRPFDAQKAKLVKRIGRSIDRALRLTLR